MASKGAKVLLIGAPTIGLLGALAGLADVIRLEGEDAPIGPGLIGALIISVVALLAAFVSLYRRSGAAPVWWRGVFSRAPFL